MTTVTTTRGRRAAGHLLKSPLAVHGDFPPAGAPPTAGAGAPAVGVVTTDRAVTLAEFEDYLRTANSRDGRPFQEGTINAYVSPGKNLDTWLTASNIDGDFTAVDSATLNRYFREYYLEHGQGGTHTLQRNLIQLFSFLERERGHPSPYDDGVNRYAEVKGRPKTLGADFIDDLLEVTGGGKARDFETARDHAIIRILRSEGIRRAELLGMVMHTLPADIIRNPVFRLVPLKGARAVGEGRVVVLAPASARALAPAALRSVAVRLYGIFAGDHDKNVKGCIATLIVALLPALEGLGYKNFMQGNKMVMLENLESAKSFVRSNDDEFLARMVKRRAGQLQEWSSPCTEQDGELAPGELATATVDPRQ